MRMPRYYVTNEGMGPYAIFYCDRCNREYRSQPNIANTVKQDVAKSAFGGLLRNVPLVGDSIADNMENNRYRTNMSQQELDAAWEQVQQYFRECPTCHQVVCIPDFDEVTGYCDQDSPRKGEIAQAQAEQAIGFMKGVANAFGVTDAIKQAQARAQAQQGQVQGQAQPQAQASGVVCAKCHQPVPAGMKFCGNCGTPVPEAAQEVKCPNCGTMTSQAFCGNCGTKVR